MADDQDTGSTPGPTPGSTHGSGDAGRPEPSGPGLRIPVGAPGVRRPTPGGPGGGGPGGESNVASMYAAVGGQPFFDELARRFYRNVASDPVLLALYPDPDDLGPAAERLALFLAQYWGGPTTYSDQRGHPRLRMRHVPYRIDRAARDHWLAAMTDALAGTLRGADASPVGLGADELERIEQQFVDYFTSAAEHLVNDPG